MNHTGSISPSVEVQFDELVETYLEQVVVLVVRGSDILIAVETIFEPWNAKRQR